MQPSRRLRPNWLPASGRSKDAVLAAIITHLTGIAPAAKKTARSANPKVDPAIVQQEVVKLKALLDKSMTPGGLSSEEQVACDPRAGAAEAARNSKSSPRKLD